YTNRRLLQAKQKHVVLKTKPAHPQDRAGRGESALVFATQNTNTQHHKTRSSETKRQIQQDFADGAGKLAPHTLRAINTHLKGRSRLTFRNSSHLKGPSQLPLESTKC